MVGKIITKKRLLSLAFRLLWLLVLSIAGLVHIVDGWVIKQGRLAYDRVYKQ